jgi:hypothetical protein
LVAASGAWVVAARLIRLGSLAAITTGVAYSISGFIVAWQGYDLVYPVVLFPWNIFAALTVIDHPSAKRVIGLTVTTALTLVSGQTDMACFVLLATGMLWAWYAVATTLCSYRWKRVAGATVLTTAGWALGFLLAAPLLLPLASYLRESARIQTRQSGMERRPPVGWKALPLVAFPEAYGIERDDTLFFLAASGSQLESAAGSYCGCIALLFAAPWAWLDRNRRSWVWCLACMALLGLGWQLNLPGIVDFWRMPPLRVFSANRFVFLSAWALLQLAAIGLEQISQRGQLPLCWSISWGVVGTLVLLIGCVAGLLLWPDELKRFFPQGIRGLSLAQLQNRFSEQYVHQFAWATICLVCWIVVWLRVIPASLVMRAVSVLMIIDLVAHAWNLHPQPSSHLYFPRLPALEFIQKSPPGRVIGMGCLPPKMLESHYLPDIRGYDGVDPIPMVELLNAIPSQQTQKLEYAQTMWYLPATSADPDHGESPKLHPVMDMLGLRYLVVFGHLRQPAFEAGGFSVVVNQRALPKVWVPKQVTRLSSAQHVLQAMKSWEFAPADQAFVVDATIDLPGNCSGDVEVTQETPQRLALMASMQTPGLVVIGDRYDQGWEATLDGRPVPILCVNYLLRGVAVPAGPHTIELHYRPASFIYGVRLFQLAAFILILLSAWSCRHGLFRNRHS